MGRADRRAGASAALALCLVVLGGCAVTEEAMEANDPFEPVNRKFHAFNNTLDTYVLEPVSDAYVAVTTQGMRTSVGNFFVNVGYANVVVNDFLQGKVHQGIQDTLRIVFNTGFGVGGLFDVASAMGLPRHEEDFGQTLAVWGAGEGAYLELPFLGPSSIRDAPGIVVAVVTSPLFYIDNLAVTVPLRAVEAVDTRARLATAIELRRQTALDSYLFTREAYRQRRQFLIHDGDPPLEEFDDFEDDFLEDDFPEDDFPEDEFPEDELPEGELPEDELPPEEDAALDEPAPAEGDPPSETPPEG